MGKRKKSSRKPGGGKVNMMPLDKSFRCIFCQHTNTVMCKMDQKSKTGRLDCKDCGKAFQTEINHLSQAIDIYSEWIDACEEINAIEYAKSNQSSNKKRPQPQSDDDQDQQEEDRDEEEPRKKLQRRKAVEEVEEEDEDAEPLERLTVFNKRAVVEDDE